MANVEDDLDLVSDQGSSIYDRLRPQLEAKNSGQFVAIHVNTGDYATAMSTAAAMRAVRKLHDEGPLYLRKISAEPEYGLAARILEGELRSSGSRK